ncbi:MAG: hypothetical protein NC453_15335, partial [Muribaculum sp.]|nr:hypothetical protein [Muribaculum sp.]
PSRCKNHQHPNKMLTVKKWFDFLRLYARTLTTLFVSAVFHEMRYLAAMYSYAIVAHAFLLLGDDCQIYEKIYAKQWGPIPHPAIRHGFA